MPKCRIQSWLLVPMKSLEWKFRKYRKTKEKTVAVVLQFPEDYPTHELLIELRSKTLDDKLLNGLTKICEEEARKYLGEPQILLVLKFVSKFLDENPLCCCSKEISTIKQTLLNEKDIIKLKQKSSSVSFSLKEGEYYFNCDMNIPHDYPDSGVMIENTNSNFPSSFCRVFLGHATEISRKCVEPPLNKKKIPKNAPPFQPKPSLLPAATFLIQYVHTYPIQNCPVCKLRCFPENPEHAVHDEKDDLHVERILCGHLYHFKCLSDYLKTPPFAGGKKCLICHDRVSHDKYKLTPELAEARWAHQQARDRELEEVVDFLL
ncbi:uncharacterized protein LOC110846281 isoform X2 [Folsomia candida]|uniref:uncharacterized protein LOC110846281 isoform X2 n=1 Tax=Folsomia candida TaxID=158441 RepID=UPI0016053E79|nr:uncharacterized protein LOC110846281 isoform X2 [Folsomia candida]